MPHPLGTPLLIANPRAGAGRVPVLRRLTAALRARGIAFDVRTTRAPGHATQLAHEAVTRHERGFIVAVGGDGTVHEVLNGLVDADTGQVRGQDPVLGIVGAGSGSDLARTFGLDRRPEVLAGHFATDATLRLDIGHVELVGRDGRDQRRVFANIAQVGFGGTVVRTAAHLPRRLGGMRYVAGVVLGAGRFRRVPVTVEVDGGTITAPLCNVLVANGQFFGNGLQVAPQALPTDGVFDVQAWGGRPRDVLSASRQLREGSHLARDDVQEWASRAVRVSPRRPLFVEADGEWLGSTPARFEVLPGLVRLKV